MSGNKILVHGGQLVTAYDKEPISNGAVAIAGEKIEAIGTYEELSKRYSDAETIGGDRFLLIPGLINAHGHGRGLSDFQRGARDNTLESWLLDTRKYLPISAYDDRVLSAARLLKSGVTTTMDNHILKDPSAYNEEFDEALRAYSDAGIRVQFNPAIRNDNPFIYGDNKAFLAALPQSLRESLTAAPPSGSLTGENFVKAVCDLHARCNGPMSKIGFGPLAPQWCTEELLIEVRRAAERLDTPIHVHAAQSIFQKIYAFEFLGKTLIEHMNDIGFLGPRLVIGHCVWPTETDIELLAQTGTAVTHHPSCNLRVRNGIAPVFHMLQAGVLVGLGMDGKSINDDDDMIQEMKVCFLLHRIPSLELESPHLSARQVFQMATENNAILLGYGQELGRLEPGRFADLILLDYEKMTYPFVEPSHDPIEVLLYRGVGRHVHTVMVNGRIIVQEGHLLTLDDEAIGAQVAEAASRPRTEKEKAFVQTMDELKAYVVSYYRDWTKKLKPEPYFSINSRLN
ncbi:MAG: amidohydrolase family protein [Deltaproteobacteria bacterium]|nr:amidohydrolase family protein [Deltaproteobacteria bacterium]